MGIPRIEVLKSQNKEYKGIISKLKEELELYKRKEEVLSKYKDEVYTLNDKKEDDEFNSWLFNNKNNLYKFLAKCNIDYTVHQELINNNDLIKYINNEVDELNKIYSELNIFTLLRKFDLFYIKYDTDTRSRFNVLHNFEIKKGLSIVLELNVVRKETGLYFDSINEMFNLYPITFEGFSDNFDFTEYKQVRCRTIMENIEYGRN